MGERMGGLNIVAKAFHDACEPPHVGSIVDWAEQHIDLPLGYVPPGLFHVAKSRHIIAPLEALHTSSRYRVVNILKATQTFGSGIADIFVPWTIANAPGPVMWNWATDQLAKQHADSRAMPVIDNCRQLQRLLPDDRHKTRNQSRGFKNGVWLYIQGPSEANLQGKSIRYLINDEVWQWPPGRLRESFARVTQYQKIGTSKVLNISQGGEIIHDEQGRIIGGDWALETLKGEWHEWEVACPSCGGYFSPKFEEKVNGQTIYRMKWDADGSNIRFYCPHCNVEMRDSDKLKSAWNDTGRYRQTNPEVKSSSVTFQWNSIIWLPWADLVARYREALRAKKSGVLIPLREFLQKVMAQHWSERDSLEVERVDLRVGDYEPNSEWPEEKVRFMTVDCQAHLNKFFVVCRSWATSGKSRRLWFGEVNSFEEVRAIQERFKIKSHHVGVDAGYEQTHVIRECARHVEESYSFGWLALKGTDADSFSTMVDGKKIPRLWSDPLYPDLMLGAKNIDVQKWIASISERAKALYNAGKLRCALVLWSNPSVYDILARLRDGKGAEWLCPASESGRGDDEYRKQMGSHVKREAVDSRGNSVLKYHKIYADHFYDCEAMQIVMASMAHCLIGI